MVEVQVVLRGVSSADEERLEGIQRRLEGVGAEGVAVIHFPLDDELGMRFDIEEENLGWLLEPAAARTAA